MAPLCSMQHAQLVSAIIPGDCMAHGAWTQRCSLCSVCRRLQQAVQQVCPGAAATACCVATTAGSTIDEGIDWSIGTAGSSSAGPTAGPSQRGIKCVAAHLCLRGEHAFETEVSELQDPGLYAPWLDQPLQVSAHSHKLGGCPMHATLVSNSQVGIAACGLPHLWCHLPCDVWHGVTSWCGMVTHPRMPSWMLHSPWAMPAHAGLRCTASRAKSAMWCTCLAATSAVGHGKAGASSQ